MANATVLNAGQINTAGATDALFLKVFGGEVLKQFQQTLVMTDARQMVRTIPNGKSAQFPITGFVTTGYHTPGTEIVGQTANSAEQVIIIDDFLLSSLFFAEIDLAKTHYDYRAPYTERMGFEMANVFDKHVLQTLLQTARAASPVTGGNGGSALTNLGYGTTAATLSAGVMLAAQTLDQKNVKQDGRFAIFNPVQYWLLMQDRNNLDQFITATGNQGSYADGKVYMIGGIEIVKSNNLPTTNITTDLAKYNVNGATTVGLVATNEAVGTVKLVDMVTESNYDPRRLGTLVTCRLAVGHGTLRPDAAVELKTA